MKLLVTLFIVFISFDVIAGDYIHFKSIPEYPGINNVIKPNIDLYIKPGYPEDIRYREAAEIIDDLAKKEYLNLIVLHAQAIQIEHKNKNSEILITINPNNVKFEKEDHKKWLRLLSIIKELANENIHP